jgi:hypothetical protein
MKKDIENYNDKGQLHGYQEGYNLTYISYRVTYKNNLHVGYSEWHGMEETIFHIR